MAGDGVSRDSSDAGREAAAATIHIRCSNGSKFSVQTALDATVGAFKILLAEKCDVPAQQQKLIYKGRILKDEQTLESYGLETDHAVHLVRGFASSDSSDNTASNPGASVANNIGSNDSDNAGLGASVFPGGLFRARAFGLFGNGLPQFDQVQQQLSQNPNMMRDILNMPAIQSLLNNPDLIRNLITTNPQMREIIDRNPDIAQVLNDPATLRQTMEAARNPELMREMMRTTDRAMSNIESSPEGFNMLRRMYETVQEPFLNAATMDGNNIGTGLDSNPFASLLVNQGNTTAVSSDAGNGSPSPNVDPLPNPWNNTGGTQQPNTRTAGLGEARSGSVGGLGGLMPDPSVLSQVLQNPAMSQMMQSLLSNPQYMNQVFNTNPHLRAAMESNVHSREMLQNPEFLRQLASPEALQQILALQQSLSPLLGQLQTNQGQNQAAGNIGDAGAGTLMQMLGGLGLAGNVGVPYNPNVAPEELYATQLAQLQEMGFVDTQENIRALVATAGNVHAAVERLLERFGQ